MMLKTVMEVAQDYYVFDYVPPRPQKDLNPQYRTIAEVQGKKPAPKFVLPGHNEEKVGKEPPPPRYVDNGQFGNIVGHHSG